MDKTKVGREEIKQNFLMRTILRCDYTGVLDLDIENSMVEISASLHEYFDNFEDSTGVQSEINPNDTMASGVESITIKDLEEIKSYSFTSDKYDMKLIVTKKFAWVMLRNTVYVSFNIYSTCLMNVIKIIKSNADYMRITRIGLRKINQIILKKIEDLSEYFESAVFSPYKLEESENISYESKDILKIRSSQLTFSRAIRNGKFNNLSVFQIVIDTDINTKEQEQIGKLISAGQELDGYNEILFDQYKKCLSEHFLECLMDPSYENENIVFGLKKNGRI